MDLTPRQTDIAQLLAAGMSNPQIAQKLFLSPHTVKRHVAAVLHRLGATTRQEAALVWVRETMPACPNCGQGR
jgi:DNA-binding NarL/FixJ family response regulator